jgi:hypothetical protein
LLEKIFVAQQFDFGIEIFLGNIRPNEIHGAGGLGRDDGVKAASAKENLEMGFIARRKDEEEDGGEQHEPKRSGYEPWSPKQGGRKIAGGGRERV